MNEELNETWDDIGNIQMTRAIADADRNKRIKERYESLVSVVGNKSNLLCAIVLSDAIDNLANSLEIVLSEIAEK